MAKKRSNISRILWEKAGAILFQNISVPANVDAEFAPIAKH